MTKPNWKPIKVKLGKIKAWDNNPRMSTKAQAQRIIASERKFGQPVPFLLMPETDGNFPLLDGHQRLAAWFTVYGADYEMDAMVCDRALTDDERREMVVTLHTGATGSWNWEALAGWSAGDLQSWGMDKDALKNWNNDANNLKELLTAEVEPVDAEPQTERADELQEKWKVKSGDLWKLGDHLLLCGDSARREDVSRLMQNDKATLLFTDPPYGVSIGNKNKFLNKFQKSGRVLTSIESDDDSAEDLGDMLLQVFTLSKDFLAEDCSIFVCSPQVGSLGMMMMMMMMRDAGMEVRHVLNWVKNSPTFSLGRLDYDYKHEPILFTWIKKHKKIMAGQFHNSVWTIDKPRANKEHPTMKPVELYENALLNHTDKGDILYEPFGGSGTGILAAQSTGRVCRMIELTERYSAVILQRFLDATGIQPELVE